MFIIVDTIVTFSNGFGFGSVRFQGKETELNRNRTVYLKQKPNQTVYELSVFKPNHLRKGKNQTV